eukprot:2986023-Pyramimonas_sp.AAC.1
MTPWNPMATRWYPMNHPSSPDEPKGQLLVGMTMMTEVKPLFTLPSSYSPLHTPLFTLASSHSPLHTPLVLLLHTELAPGNPGCAQRW